MSMPAISRKHLDFAAKLLFFLTLIGFAFTSFLQGGMDFRGYYAAGKLVLRGGNPYEYAQIAPVLEEVTGWRGNNPYYYPPWFALLFVPLALLPFQVARGVWLAINVVLFYLSLEYLRKGLHWQVTGWARWIAYWAAILMFAVYCMVREQAGILTLFGLAFALKSTREDRPALVGLGFVIALAKPQVTALAVLLTALWMLSRRATSPALWTAVWLVVLALVASVAIPRWWQFDRSGFAEGITYQLDGPDQIASRRIYATAYHFFAYVFRMSAPQQYLATAVIGLLGGGLAAIVWRRIDSACAVLSVSTMLSLLITPYVLQYDYVVLTIPLFWIFSHMRSLHLWLRVIVIVVLVASFSVQIWQTWSYQGYWQLLGVLAAFALVVKAELSRRRIALGK